MKQFAAGDAVMVAVDYETDGTPVLAQGRVLLIRPSNHPSTRSLVAEIDAGGTRPRVAYLHDLARWNV